jgi:hypothetical protein
MEGRPLVGPRLGPVTGIVSGGQTGVDRAALDFAVERGMTYHGWVPAGGWAEDLEDPPGLLARYPFLRPTDSTDPADRTRRNVSDCDAVVIVSQAGVISPGSDLTLEEVHRLERPVLRLDLGGPNAVHLAARFLRRLPNGSALDVAGPRESEAPGIYLATLTLLASVAAQLHAG